MTFGTALVQFLETAVFGKLGQRGRCNESYEMDNRGIAVQFPTEVRDFSLHHSASHSIGTATLFPRSRVDGV
jgi:hypothetical protein